MIKKLKYLTSLPITLLPGPKNPFEWPPHVEQPLTITPLEYAQAMLTCWHDKKWTRGSYEKTFEQLKNFKLKLKQTPSQETIKEYSDFYSKVVVLLEKSKNIMPSEQLQSS